MEAIKNKIKQLEYEINLIRSELPKDSLSGVDVRVSEVLELIGDYEDNLSYICKVRQ